MIIISPVRMLITIPKRPASVVKVCLPIQRTIIPQFNAAMLGASLKMYRYLIQLLTFINSQKQTFFLTIKLGKILKHRILKKKTDLGKKLREFGFIFYTAPCQWRSAIANFTSYKKLYFKLTSPLYLNLSTKNLENGF